VRNPKRSELRDRFLDWQCRIRQIAMRLDGGRPSPGMRPRVLDGSGRELAALTVLLLPKHPEESTAFFRFQVMKTSDPRDLYERGLTYLQADYFQKPETFSDRSLAVLPQDSPVAAALIEDGDCTLFFGQSNQSFTLPCKARALKTGDTAREAALWHNRLFNPALPETVHVIAFEPDWASAKSP
jgi:hypothetical protein